MPPSPNPVYQSRRSIFKPRPLVWAVLGTVVLVSVITLVLFRTQLALKVSLARSLSVEVVGPLELDFGQDIATGFKAIIEPHVPGSWKHHRSLFGVSATSFTPASRFEAGRSYKVQVTNLKRIGTGAAIPDITQTFTTQTPAAIKSIRPTAGAKDVQTNTQLTIDLDSANKNVRDLRASLTPAVPLKLVSTDDRIFTWEPTTPLKQGTTYNFTLDDARVSSPDKRRLATVAFTTVTQPVIVSARTGDHFAPGQTVDIVFDQPMQPDTAAFQFDFKGKGAWPDDHTYRFIPEDIKPAATYTYKLKAGLKSKAGGVLEADRPFQFATNGAVTAGASPGGGDIGLGTPIRIAFDQAVDHASAQSRFSISPGVAGNFSWSGNTMIYASSGLAYQTNYAYSIAPGVVPIWGLPSPRAIGGSFATTPQTIKLNVPLFKQTFGNGCELTSLRMALAYRGIGATEWDIVQRIGYNPRNRDTATNTWDDPNATFVGFLNGYQNSTGYGVHAGPIAAAAQTFGHKSTAYYGISPQFISARIHEGNPVIFWGNSTPAKADAWNTPTGGVVQTWLSAHARVAYGVVGSPDAPIGFYINDPWKGSTFYWTAAQVMANMNVIPGVSNQAVVVY